MQTYKGKNYITYKDIMKEKGVSRATAYKILRENFANEEFQTIKIAGIPKPINTAIEYKTYIKKMGSDSKFDILFKEEKKNILKKYNQNPRAMAETIVKLEYDYEELEEMADDNLKDMEQSFTNKIGDLQYNIHQLRTGYVALQKTFESLQEKNEREIKEELHQLQNKIKTFLKDTKNEKSN